MRSWYNLYYRAGHQTLCKGVTPQDYFSPSPAASQVIHIRGVLLLVEHIYHAQHESLAIS